MWACWNGHTRTSIEAINAHFISPKPEGNSWIMDARVSDRRPIPCTTCESYRAPTEGMTGDCPKCHGVYCLGHLSNHGCDVPRPNPGPWEIKDPTTETWWDERLQKNRLYPHLWLTRVPNEEGHADEKRRWGCTYCRVIRVDVNDFNKFGCTERKESCKWCGEKPLCAPDCLGVRMALSEGATEIVGGNPFP